MADAVKNVVTNSDNGIGISEPPSLTGQTYSFQFWSPILTGPGTVSAALSTAIGHELQKMPATTVPNMPEVKVVKMSCLTSDPNIQA